ncbi:mannose-6-phosphate isomerase [Musicola keenii]|uniref:mannose-6-phosphate isomerase n=1 Tax=Musicola keenii TaxID=2884250 RepID=UPI001783327F|nr:mannose-6-phosphate isomerase [Musicola keenii]
MQKMRNNIQHYAWGSKHALTELYGIANPDGLPMAELWMGAHPKSSSFVLDDNGAEHNLRDRITADLSASLGDAVARRFGELPFLFKVLCAEQPLSIQVHPSKSAAEEGYARENAAGIPFDSPERNYKDANHKPELVFALTPFLAMNGFRESSDMISQFTPLADAHPAIGAFLQQPDSNNLSILFSSLLNMSGEEKRRALDMLFDSLEKNRGEPWDTIRFIAQFYPDDSGLFSPLLLNVVQLQPGEAMFLHAETPHAYLHGVGLEVMANSDNVLRAGLTPKYIDIPELVANVKFVGRTAESLLTRPIKNASELRFPIPVDDFAFSLHSLDQQAQTITLSSAAIIFCINGKALLDNGHQTVMLSPGESCFIPANDAAVSVQGEGHIARVYNQPLSV